VTKTDAVNDVLDALVVALHGKNRTVDEVLTGLKVVVGIVESIISVPDDDFDPETLRLKEPFADTLAKLGVTQTDIDAALKN